MVDNQNINARYIDKYSTSGTTSSKVSNPPGGKSTFTLGWETTNTNDYKKNDSYNVYTNSKSQNVDTSNKNFKNLGGKGGEVKNESNIGKGLHQGEKSSIIVKKPPGGESSIKFG